MPLRDLRPSGRMSGEIAGRGHHGAMPLQLALLFLLLFDDDRQLLEPALEFRLLAQDFGALFFKGLFFGIQTAAAGTILTRHILTTHNRPNPNHETEPAQDLQGRVKAKPFFSQYPKPLWPSASYSSA